VTSLRQAVILAAGKGMRLSKYTKNVPKSFLPIKYGQTIIDRMLSQLKKNGIRDVVVVLGFKEEYGLDCLEEISRMDETFHLHPASNPYYEHTGTLKSLLIAAEFLPYAEEDFLLIEGDVICVDTIIEMIANSGDNKLVVDSSSALDEESMKYTLDEERKIKRISKNIPDEDCDGEFIGISSISGKTWKQFLLRAQNIDSEIPDAFYEEVIHQGSVDFEVLDIAPLQWTEVDFPDEYKRARHIFAQEKKISIDRSLLEKTSHTPSIFSISKDLDIQIHDFCFLANPYMVDEEFINTISMEIKQLISTYPPLQPQLAELVSAFHDHRIPPENIVVGNGASEIIHFLNESTTGSIVPIPTFSEYTEGLPNVATYQLQEMDHFNIDVDDFVAYCKKCSPLHYPNIILINPNNPVGRILKREEVIHIARELEDFNVIVDESFINFADPSYSILDIYDKFENMCVIKSFGKILGMPGIRLGALYSHSNIIKKIRSKTPVWNVNSIGAYVLRLMSNPDFRQLIHTSCEQTKKATEKFFDALSQIEGIKPYAPTANFVFVKLLGNIGSAELRDRLLEDRILVRDCSNKIGLYPKFLRIATRKDGENKKLIRHLQMILAEKSDGSEI